MNWQMQLARRVDAAPLTAQRHDGRRSQPRRLSARLGPAMSGGGSVIRPRSRRARAPTSSIAAKALIHRALGARQALPTQPKLSRRRARLEHSIDHCLGSTDQLHERG